MLKNMKVKKSLILGFGLVIVVSLIIIITSVVMMLNQRNQYEILMNEDVVTNESILYARFNATLAGRNYRDALLVPDSEANDTLIANAETALVEMQEYTDSMYETWPSQLTDQTLLNQYNTINSEWRAIAEEVIALYEQYRASGNALYLEQANTMIYEEDTPKQTEMANVAQELDKMLVEGMEAERAKIEKSIMITIIVIIVAMIVATIAVIAFALVLIKSITVPTEQVRAALVGFSEGKLDIPVEYESKNELGEMCDALRRSQYILSEVIGDTSRLLTEMARGNFDVSTKDEKLYVGSLVTMFQSIRGINRQLSDTLTQITLSAEQVAAGSEQVSTGAQALAQGATEQASAVEELSATIAEISNNSQNNAKSSETAMDKVQYTTETINESAHYMEEMVQAMDKISNSSQEIAKIIATIENIAFQTNILALNAAVEAARAGSAGKGFAVVADEVRNLSAKSDQAAKATKDLIDNSVASVQEGSAIVKKVSDALERTVSAASEVQSSVQTIAKAVEEESEAIAQVTEGIDQISSVVQTNSATSEESAAASEELSSQAAIIKELMSRFKLRSTDEVAFNAPASNYQASAKGDGDAYAAVTDFSKY